MKRLRLADANTFFASLRLDERGNVNCKAFERESRSCSSSSKQCSVFAAFPSLRLDEISQLTCLNEARSTLAPCLDNLPRSQDTSRLPFRFQRQFHFANRTLPHCIEMLR